jgi:hypothetical protein
MNMPGMCQSLSILSSYKLSVEASESFYSSGAPGGWAFTGRGPKVRTSDMKIGSGSEFMESVGLVVSGTHLLVRMYVEA